MDNLNDSPNLNELPDMDNSPDLNELPELDDTPDLNEIPHPPEPDTSGVSSPDEEARPLKSRAKRFIIRFGILFGFLLIVFVGLTVMLYPSISDYVNNKNASRLITIYDDALVALSAIDQSMYLEAARAYNERLAESGAAVKDAFGEAAQNSDSTDEYWQLLDVTGNGMMGYVEIEILNIKLPLYHGTSEVVLAKGAGHIQGSSLPVGGESAHAVVSAHTGLPRAKLFTGVDTLRIGDTFTMHILGDELTYEIDQILTVLPHEVDALGILRGEDYVTLVTCTPYGINSHRLLIRGTRIETPVHETEQEADEAVAEEEPGWFQKLKDQVVAAFSYVVEGLANGLVAVAEWCMDLFGVEY